MKKKTRLPENGHSKLSGKPHELHARLTRRQEEALNRKEGTEISKEGTTQSTEEFYTLNQLETLLRSIPGKAQTIL